VKNPDSCSQVAKCNLSTSVAYALNEYAHNNGRSGVDEHLDLPEGPKPKGPK